MIFFALIMTIFSIVLYIADVREIGLYNCGLCRSLFGFSRGMMMAFHCSGNLSSSDDLSISLSTKKFFFFMQLFQHFIFFL